MSSSKYPTGNEAPRDDFPPTEQLPGYEQAVEQVARSTNTTGSNAPQSGSEQYGDTSFAPQGSVPEGSNYVGSSRPSDVPGQDSTPLEAGYDFDANIPHDSEPANPDQPPPAYTELPGQIDNEGLGTNAIVAEDGRVNIRIDQKSRALSQLILPQLQRQLTQSREDPAPPPAFVPEFLGGAPGQEPPPPLNIVIQVVGSRGDVQPFVALGRVLKDTYGHRVRLATHPTFKDFVIENGLEFFSIGGDPAELMAFMVKNPGLMPGFDVLRSGDVGKRRKGIAEILRGTWRSCIETGNGLGVDPLKQTVEEWMGVEDQLPEQLKKPFVADAIIANPPAFGHIHCAEKLGIPLHMMFTMPWSPTQQFPHPLANIQSSNADPTITNYISYILVDVLTWQGLGDVINKFRKDSLHLDPISTIWGPAILARLRIPFTYCWSPALIPKPRDWNHHISIAGFYFLNLASNYTPEPDLVEFLAAGEPPVYIGFGSIVVDDPNAMTKLIFDAVKITGRRALVSKGWGGLGADDLGKPDGVFMLGNCPHDWLFKHVSAVVHHGGAGTTAAGIAAGRPTVVVPFFGDQAFWGAMVSRAGAGPDPMPYKDLTAEKLATAINEALKPESLERAQELRAKIEQENGTQKGAQSFHQMLNYDEIRCAVMPNKPAVWRVKRTQTKLSAKAATILAQQGEVSFSDLKLYRAREYVPDEGPLDPVSGAAGALMGTATSFMMGVADMPIQTLKLLNIHPDSRSKKGKEKATGDKTPGDADMPLEHGPSPNDLTQTNSDTLPLGSIRTPETSTHRSTYMSQAFADSTGGSRSPSRERVRQLIPDLPLVGSRRGSSISGTGKPSPTDKQAKSARQPGLAESMESAVDTGKGLARIVGAGFKSPMDFSLGVAKGFHNVPKLYGAEVRQVDKVTDLQSGLRTAAKEFGFGLYDGITGIVTDPYKGAKKEGGIGFVKGVGRGVMNVPFRVLGGAWSVPGYAMKGLYQEMVKSKGKSVQNYIIAARIAQGYDEASSITQKERDDVVNRWKHVKVSIKKKRNPGAEQIDSLHSLVEEKRKRRTDRWEGVNSAFKKPESRPSFPPDMSAPGSYHEPTRPHNETEPEIRSTIPSWRQQEAERARSLRRQNTDATGQSQASQSAFSVETQLTAEEEEAEQRELEKAIAASVAEASRGNPEEDELMASAIRASIAELERTPVGTSESDEEAALKRAIAASIADAGKKDMTAEEQAALEETLRKSLLESSVTPQAGVDLEWDEDEDTDEEEVYQRIIAESKELAHLHSTQSQDHSGTMTGAGMETGVMDAMSAAIGANQESGNAAASGNGPAHAQQTGITYDEDEEMKKVLEESEKAEKDRLEALHQQRTEEDIVMEYVRKQSLLEEEHRRRVAGGK